MIVQSIWYRSTQHIIERLCHFIYKSIKVKTKTTQIQFYFDIFVEVRQLSTCWEYCVRISRTRLKIITDKLIFVSNDLYKNSNVVL